MGERAETVAMSSDEGLVVLSTFASAEQAVAIARTLVGEQLAACVNLVPGVRSVYRWQGDVHEDLEHLAVMKTTRDRFEALAARLAELHPYEVPEIIALPLAAGHAPYLAWLVEAVR
jgi:periplasmic divalent cation tolerance protein